MASWLQQQLKAAETILEKVDAGIGNVALRDESTDGFLAHGDVPDLSVLQDELKRRIRASSSRLGLERHQSSDESGSESGTEGAPAESSSPTADAEATIEQQAQLPPTADAPDDLPASAPSHGSQADNAVPSSGASTSQQPNAASQTKRLEKKLAKVKSRYDALKHESVQLEDLLQLTETSSSQKSKYIEQLNAELVASKHQSADHVRQLQQKCNTLEAELHQSRRSQQAIGQQLAAALAKVAALEEAQQQSIEGNMLEALNAQLLAAQAKLDQERKASQASKVAAAARERELQVRQAACKQRATCCINIFICITVYAFHIILFRCWR